MSLDTSSALTPPRAAHTLDEGKLTHYLRASIPQLSSHPDPLTVQQFKHGQSNPTYLLNIGSEQLVLRKKPPGKLLASAHAVDREYQVLRALSQTAVPVPKPLVLCNDPDVLGTQFYVMEFAKGQIFLDPNLPSATPQQRTAVYTHMADTLAALHAVNPTAIGLQSYGNPNNYCQRQVSRWAKQYHASVATAMPEVVSLIDWLQRNIPAEDVAPPAPAICHGDYRLDNLVFDGQLKVRAVLDWELSTLGNPWADVAYCCMAYHMPDQLPNMKIRHPLAPGIPDELTLLSRYCAARRVSMPSARDWSFYLALSLFRLVAILAGVQSRARQGNASSAAAAAISRDEVLLALTNAALDIIHSNGSSREEINPVMHSVIDSVSISSSASSSRVHGAVAEGPGGAAGAVRSGQHSQTAGQSLGQTMQSTVGTPAAKQIHTTIHANLHSGSSKAGATAGSSTVQPAVKAGSSSVDQSVPSLGEPSPRAKALLERLEAFLSEHVYPAEHVFEEHAGNSNRWSVHPLMEQLKEQAKKAGLWNLFIPADLCDKLQHLLPEVPKLERSILLGPGLSNLDYAHLCERMGRSVWAPEVFNCGAPDTGNMEVLARYGTREQQLQWLLPLLRGEIRSCFAMTEKAVASSDATNITASITKSADDGGYTLNGVKWWTSGAMDPRCKIAIFMGKTDPSAPPHAQQSMILVPMTSPGVRIIRPMMVYGYDDAPHGHAEVHFEDVKVPAGNLLLGEGRGFEIAQGRLGPGRLHHCMRLVGMAERGVELMTQRALQRVAFGKPLAAQGALREKIAHCRIDLDGARLLVLAAAHALDRVGHKRARSEIAAAKVCAPNVALSVLDASIQAHGAAGVSQDTVLAHLWAAARTLRIADGPDEVHLGSIAKVELQKVAARLGLKSRL